VTHWLEDDLLKGLLDACYVGGWLCQHVRRSDLGIIQGHAGFPDIVASHPELHRTLYLEAKSTTGRTSPLQDAWLDSLRASGTPEVRIVRPADYDATWRELVGERLVKAHSWRDDPDER
jgi:hypothetical protein